MADIIEPGDLILPNPKSKEEQDLFNSLLDYATGLNQAIKAIIVAIEDLE